MMQSTVRTHLRCTGLATLGGLWAVLAGCSSSDDAGAERAVSPSDVSSAPADPAARVPYADLDSSAGGSAAAGEASGAPPSGGALPPSDSAANPGLPRPQPDPGQVPPGTLTAGAWDDNRNLERFLDYRGDLQQQSMPGLLAFTEEDHEAAQAAFAELAAHTTLDISFVIDTTGSMADELQYLQTEFLAISAQIEQKYPEADQRWSLIVYRDEGDEYTTRHFDFNPSPEEFRTHLAEQSAGGGGDFPEAPHAALGAMNQLAWRSGAETAKLAFWVADAPHHVDKAAELTSAIQAAQGQGVHIYPVASSGIDEFTELSMRSAAQLTGGRYLFLTDDSGIGGDHKEPSIPCYFVTKLDDAILRMVDVEMTGQYREPAEEEIVRTGGDPQDGACTLESGQTVFVF